MDFEIDTQWSQIVRYKVTITRKKLHFFRLIYFFLNKQQVIFVISVKYHKH